MKKTIYSGSPEGLYIRFEFEPFLNGLKDATPIVPLPHSMGDEIETVIVYHIMPHNVTLRYATDNASPAESRVTLFGDERGIGEVEKIILAEAAKHKPEPSLVGK